MAKRALLVGIDIYPYPPNNLNSCVSDTLAFRQMLINSYQFDPADISMIHNQDATYDNVTAGLTSLFAGAVAGDHLVYFESSHGYRYTQGDTLVEVLCLYDKFLTDTDFVSRTKDLPPEVLTVVLDACHSGGMDKMFFPKDQPAVARAKVFQPSPEQQAQVAGLLAQVTKYSFFGRKPTSSAATIVNAFGPAAQKEFKIQASKAPVELELNGVLFAACTSDQTAAAGSLATNNLSAFTYGLTSQIDPHISLNDLCSIVDVTLANLSMAQTPVYFVPVADQGLAQKTFITMQPATAAPPAKEFQAGDGATSQAITKTIVDLQQRSGVPAGA